DQPRSDVPAHRRLAGVGVAALCREDADERRDDRSGRLALRRRTGRQRRLGHPAAGRNASARPLDDRAARPISRYVQGALSISMSEDLLFMALRRLRAPLITLIVVYAVSVGGLALVPGLGADGHPQRMTIFHAFYVMSFTATTIGFGEIPYPFSDAQRMWITFSIYMSVIGWAYTLASVIALANDPIFRGLLARAHFARRVRHP